MHWFRFVPVVFFSFSSLFLFVLQFKEIMRSIREMMAFYKKKSS
ncbi:hypothetical protein [Domibacillus indicus]|nr:hypothetical protein [Domibacillus indicus]